MAALRHYDERYRDAFAWECQELKRVREEMGLTNVIPRSVLSQPDEGRCYRDGKARFGVGVRRATGICDVSYPAMWIMAEEFQRYLMGFPNDLTSQHWLVIRLCCSFVSDELQCCSEANEEDRWRSPPLKVRDRKIGHLWSSSMTILSLPSFS